jgi:hypothetical protein
MKNRFFRIAKGVLVGLVFCAAVSNIADAETIFLKDGSSLEGQLIHFYDGVLTVTLESGEQRKIKSDRINRIEYVKSEANAALVQPAIEVKPPSVPTTPKAPSSEALDSQPQVKKVSPKHFRTPKTTFQHWRISLLSGDIEGMASCFVESAKTLMLEKLQSIPEDRRQAMIEQTRATKFKMQRPKIKGDRATMNVRRKLNKQKVSEIYSFQLEEGGWKIIPK